MQPIRHHSPTMRATALLAGSLLLLSACSGQATPPAVEIFDAADLDRNGALGPAEIEALAHARFARLDRNGDGELDLAELGLAGLPPEQQTLPFDLDGNGRMSPAEHLVYVRTVIGIASDRGNHSITWQEVDRRLVR